MPNKAIELGIVGVGKIVHDQHLPSIVSNPAFNLAATASRNASLDQVPAYTDITSMLDASNMDAVALCMPPQYRQVAARIALERGKHVLLEKPPGATVSQVEQLAEIANANGVTLYATWHSRHGAAVETAKALLSERRLISATLTWKEDVRKWHPDQEWIWQAGGLGVFDPGINGVSILTYCLASPIYVNSANMKFPSNRATPIAAEIDFRTVEGISIDGQFDWRDGAEEAWNIDFETDQGLLQLKGGGAVLKLDGQDVSVPERSRYGEYEEIYSRFAQLIHAGRSDVDLRPLQLVADAFLLANHEEVSAFHQK